MAASDVPETASTTGHETDGVRPTSWVLGIAFGLLTALLVPIFHHWFRLSSNQGKDKLADIGDASLFGAGFLPVLPLCMLLLLVLVWNPLVRRTGSLAALALRRKELLLILALGYGTAGIAEAGLVRNWTNTLFMESAISTKKEAGKYKEVRSQSPYAFSLAPIGDVEEAITLDERFLAILADPAPADPGDLRRIQAGYAGMRLTAGLLPGPAAQEALVSLIAGTGVERGPVIAEVQRSLGELLAERELQTGLTQGGRDLAAIFTPTIDGGSSPWSRLLGPLSRSSALIIAGLLFIVGIAALTARQWTQHERLPHPLVQVPDAIASGGVLRHAGFRTGLVIVLGIWLYQMGAKYAWHPLPGLPVGNEQPLVKMSSLWEAFQLQIQPGSKWVYEGHWGTVKIFPYLIAVAFLLGADIGFSVWGGFWFGCLFAGWLALTGLPVDFYKHGRQLGGSGGALLAMALVIAWLGRFHYWKLCKAAVGLANHGGDRVGVLGARLTMACSVVILILTWQMVGGGWVGLWAGVLSLLVTASFVVVTARVVAESGLACFQSSSLLHELVVGFGTPWILPVKAVILLNYLGATLVMDTRQQLSGYLVQSEAMASKAGQSRVGLFVAIAGVLVVGAFLAMVGHLGGMWSGSTGVGSPSGLGQFGGNNLVAMAHHAHKAVFLGLNEAQLSIAFGFVLVFAVVGLRRVWAGCPLHPLGLVVAACWPVHLAWGSLMLGWLAKVLVLRYGGAGTYKKLKPLAYGIILGDVVGYGFHLLVRSVGRLNETDLGGMGMWP